MKPIPEGRLDIGYEKYEGPDDDVYERSERRQTTVRKPVPAKNVRRPPHSRPEREPDVAARSLRLFQKGEYAQCSELLAPYVEDNRRDILSLKLLAFSLIYTGHLDQTKRLFQRVLDINKNDAEALNALAYYELSQGNTEAAINHLLDAMYVDRQHPRLKENLDKIREMRDPKIFVSMTKPGEFLFIELPKPDFREIMAEKVSTFFRSRSVKLTMLVLLILVTVGMVWLFWPSLSNALSQYRNIRLGISNTTHRSLDEIDRLVEERQRYNIHMTDEEYQQKFLSIRANLQEGKRNLAQITINEILNSDAPELVKERTIILQEFVPDPDISNLDYIPPFTDVVKTPHRYQGVYVKWNGTISGIEHVRRDETIFDLMINLNDPNIVEGVAQVYFEGFVRALNGEKVTVFGEVAGITLDNQVVIRGHTIIRLR